MRLAILIPLLLSSACAAGSIEPLPTSEPDDTGAIGAGDGAGVVEVGPDSGSDAPDAGGGGGGGPDGGALDSGPPETAPSGPRIDRSYGDGTSLMGGWGAGVTLGVRVVDAAGKPAAGVPVTWSSRPGDFAYFPGASGATSFVSTTDEDGWSTPAINAPNPSVPVTASLLRAAIAGDSRSFRVQTTNNGDSTGPAGQQAFPGPGNPNHASLGPFEVGKTVPNALTFDVVCSNATRCYGVPLADVGARVVMNPGFFGKSDPKIDPPVECAGVEPLADAKGHIRCDLVVKRAYTGTVRVSVGQFTEFEYTIAAK